jgi:hypothetical protein
MIEVDNKVIVIRTNGHDCIISSAVPEVGDKVLLIPSSGGNIAVPTAVPEVGDKVLLMVTGEGQRIVIVPSGVKLVCKDEQTSVSWRWISYIDKWDLPYGKVVTSDLTGDLWTGESRSVFLDKFCKIYSEMMDKYYTLRQCMFTYAYMDGKWDIIEYELTHPWYPGEVFKAKKQISFRVPEDDFGAGYFIMYVYQYAEIVCEQPIWDYTTPMRNWIVHEAQPNVGIPLYYEKFEEE